MQESLLRCSLLLGVVGLFVIHGAAGAQQESSVAADAVEVCTPGGVSYFDNAVIGVSGVPYSATLKVTFDQRLSDGHTIHGVTRLLNARDSNGRTRTENATGCWRDLANRPQMRLNVRVADPTAGTLLDWNTGGAVLKLARMQYRPESFPRSMGFPEWRASESELNEPGESTRRVRTELLGTKMLDQIEVHGERTTITTHDEKGDAVVVETREQWVSLELGIVMAEMIDDPVLGRTEIEMEHFQLGEPDAAFFLPPDGYAIIKQDPMVAR